MKRKISPARGRKKKKPAAVVPKQPTVSPNRPSFPVVGIGASAGGLEALEAFPRSRAERQRHGVRHRPAPGPDAQGHHGGTAPALHPDEGDPGQGPHPDPCRTASIVIPPNKDMSILHGVLHLLEPASPRGLRLADRLLLALARARPAGAQHRRDPLGHGIGRHAGAARHQGKRRRLALVQDPTTAKFDGMPRSAIDAGLADIVAPRGRAAGEDHRLPETHAAGAMPTTSRWKTRRRARWTRRSSCLRTHTGHDFSLYKKNTFYRRIERRMGIHQIEKIADLRPLPAGELAGAGSALQGTVDRGDEFLPRPRRLEGLGQTMSSRTCSPAGRPAMSCGRGCPAAPRAKRPIRSPWSSRRWWTSSSPRENHAADLRHRPGQGRDRQGAPRAFIPKTSSPTCRRSG